MTVSPLEVATNTRERQTFAYGPYYPFHDPRTFGYYGSLGYRPYYSSFARYPIIIAHRGGGRRRR